MPDPLTLLAFAFILGAVIFIHESGHYFVAKALGIKVEVFSLGFGQKLLRWPRGGTGSSRRKPCGTPSHGGFAPGGSWN